MYSQQKSTSPRLSTPLSSKPEPAKCVDLPKIKRKKESEIPRGNINLKNLIDAIEKENSGIKSKEVTKEENEKLQTDEEKIKDISTENQHLELEIQSLYKQISERKIKCKQLEDERELDMKSKSEREQSSGRELLQVKQDNERLQKEKEDLVKEKARLDKKCKQLEDEREIDMKRKSEREQSSGRELLQVKQDNERLQKEKEDIVKEKARLDKNNMQTALFPLSVEIGDEKTPFNLSEKLVHIFESVCAIVKSTNENETEDNEAELDTINTLRDLFHSEIETTDGNHNNQEEENEEIRGILPLVRKQFPEFAQECIEFCRDIVRHNPPLLLMFAKEMKKGSRINTDMYDCYKESGERFKCLVWPALISKSDGSVYRKGLVRALV